MNNRLITKQIILFCFFYSSSLPAQINPATNKISVDISTAPQNAAFNYDSCFAIGKNLGMTQVGLFLNWTTLEVAPNTFDFSLIDIANIYYPAYGVAVDLNLNPINTNHLEVPSDLNSTAFDNTFFINRYKTLLDSVKKHAPQLTLSSFIIGSESDVYLGTNSALWTQYKNFYSTVSSYARTIWPGLKVAAEFTYGGLTTQNTFAQQLNASSDYIGVSYYPLNSDFTVKPVATIDTAFNTLVNLYPSKPICLYQYGYPSSTTCNSSLAQQSQFITQTFKDWDLHASNICMIDFTWLHDLDTASVNHWAAYYGISNPAFLEYLHTLGLREWNGNGTDKPALNELRCQAQQRGYNSLPVSCTTDLDENIFSQSIFSIYPNLATNVLSVHFPAAENKSTVQIFNSTGMLMKEAEATSINISDLPAGLYFVHLKNGPQPVQRFMKE